MSLIHHLSQSQRTNHRSAGIIFTAVSSRWAVAAALTTLGIVAACASGTPVTRDATSSPDGGSDDGGALEVAHSLGVIELGEAHAAGGTGASSPIVSVAFYPDAKLLASCATQQDGCELRLNPKCDVVSNSLTGCDSGDVCVYDESCVAKCVTPPVCKETCKKDEKCAYPFGKTSGTAVCTKVESFDAGPIAFSGTTTSLSFYPPYQLFAVGAGAPFLPGSELRVVAQGAVEAGFEKFDETFVATTFVQTKTSLDRLPRSEVFGSGPLKVEWLPGNDAMEVSVGGANGSATCTVSDAAGAFDIPRSLISRVTSSKSSAGSDSLTISLARVKTTIKRDKVAKGSLGWSTVQPTAWLELTTKSVETASFVGCPTGYTYCEESSQCENLETDRDNCGVCGKICSSSSSCVNGKCIDPQACSNCQYQARIGTCSDEYSTCAAVSGCTSRATCLVNCTSTSCRMQCEGNYPDGEAEANAYVACVTQQCSSQCNQ